MAQDTMTVSGVTWDRVESEKTCHYTTTVGITRVDVYAKGDGWMGAFNEGEAYYLRAVYCLQDAMRKTVYDATH